MDGRVVIGIWGAVPIALLEDPRIRENELRVYIAVSSLQGTADECEATRGAIAKRSGIRRFGSVSAALTSLEEKGWIVRTRCGVGRSNRYRVLHDTEHFDRVPMSGVTVTVTRGVTDPVTQDVTETATSDVTKRVTRTLAQPFAGDHFASRITETASRPLSLGTSARREREESSDGLPTELYDALKDDCAERKQPSAFMSRRWRKEVGEVLAAGITADAIREAFRSCLDRQPWRAVFFGRDFLEWQRLAVETRQAAEVERKREEAQRRLREELDELRREAQRPRTAEELAEYEAAIERLRRLGVLSAEASGRA